MTDAAGRSASVRRARIGDLQSLGKLAGLLVRQHHETDPGRFFLPERVEEGYGSWLRRELRRQGAVVLVAELRERIVGYAYGTLEPRDWNALLDEYGAIHDILVDPEQRRAGIGRELLQRLVAELEALGAARVLLHTMVTNEAAQKLFASCGFRATMLEMTRNR